jgi:hypothetical protein
MSARTNAHRGALEAIERVLNRGGDADGVLRHVVAILHERGGYAWAAIRFVEGTELVLGPTAGTPGPAATVRVEYQGRHVAALEASPAATDEDDRSFLERVATLVSPYCVVAWDTGGERGQP